jgi:hypothetical protein
MRAIKDGVIQQANEDVPIERQGITKLLHVRELGSASTQNYDCFSPRGVFVGCKETGNYERDGACSLEQRVSEMPEGSVGGE